MKRARQRLVVQGQVQGVGFRPFVFNLAEESGLCGFVRNSPKGVVIEIQGEPGAVAAFAGRLQENLPPLARITDLSCEALAPLEGQEAFVISASSAGDSHAVLISPDTSVCPDCLADMAERGSRRFRYPFTNCTNCGPRYTITRSIPYDRPATSMACFPMCPDCLAEYQNPKNRRFHAQPNACSACGPRVWLTAGEGRQAEGDAALRALAGALLDGSIAAVKGLGGFHLCCDARDDAAIARLRQRKERPHKPFAVMAADLNAVRAFADPGPDEEALLTSKERPIVLCRRRPDIGGKAAAAGADLDAGGEGEAWRAGDAADARDAGSVGDARHSGSAGSGKKPLRPGGLSRLLAPDTDLLGVMLPYTPLHFALFEHLQELAKARGDHQSPVLVMTSGNPGGQPICLGNREALDHLGAMADIFLFHDRDILIRVDDSVLRCPPEGGSLFYRRARGYVPLPLSLKPGAAAKAGLCVLGVGAELKNSLCLTKGGDAFVSQHIGDMANMESAAFHEEIREHLADLLRVAPGLVVRDLHPDYLASRMAEELAEERGLPLLSLQHHAAHAFALLAEHSFSGRALVLTLDGTGLGDDGTLWGGEFLLADSGDSRGPRWERLGRLARLDLPGGEAAIREPWRMAHALLARLGLAQRPDWQDCLPWLPQRAQAAALIPVLVERRVNCPASSSCGRLFDAVAALLGLCQETTYEGQAAIRLEAAQGPAPWERQPDRLYDLPLRDQGSGLPLVLDSRALFADLARDALNGPKTSEKTGELALRFHHSLAEGLAKLAVRLAKEHGLRHVGLSGGCLQNVTLALLLARKLRAGGLELLEHRLLPPGDGCISLGQAYWGWLKLRAGQPDGMAR